MKKYLTTLLLLSFFFSCRKPGGSSGGNGFTPQPGSESLSAIIITTVERDALGNGLKYLNVLEPGGTPRWRKVARGATTDGYVNYGSGKIVVSEPGVTTHSLYVYDINTGNEVWSKLNSAEVYYFPIIRNDTLYCSSYQSNASSFGNIVAFQANTGAFLWRKQILFPYWPVNCYLDGPSLYFIVTESSTQSKVVSLDINTRNVNWVSPGLGINLANSFSRLDVSENQVFVKTGTKLMMALSRSTGQTVWTKPGIPFNQPVVSKNSVVSLCARDSYYPVSNDSLLGLHAFDAASGNLLWKWNQKIEFANSNPAFGGNLLFQAGLQTNASPTIPKGFLTALNPATGQEIWSIQTGIEYYQICSHLTCVGNRLFAFKYPNGNLSPQARIVSYDFSTGALRDSIPLTGESFSAPMMITTAGKVIRNP